MLNLNYCKAHVTRVLFYLSFMLFFVSTDLFSQASDTTKSTATILFSNLFFNQKKIDTVSVDNKLDLLNYFNVLKCLSGTLYFSEGGFESTVTIQYKGNSASLKACFERCVSGSKFTLDNCAFERDGGLKPKIVNMIIVFR